MSHDGTPDQLSAARRYKNSAVSVGGTVFFALVSNPVRNYSKASLEHTRGIIADPFTVASIIEQSRTLDI